jgi:hypothetical protein
MKTEIWKDIEGFEGCYQISNFGRVKSLERQIKHPSGGLRTIKERILKGAVGENGYWFVCLYRGKKIKKHSIHRLVALYFIENTNNYKDVDHINRVKTDNRIENLRWVNRSTNLRNSNRSDNSKSKYNGVYWNKKAKKWFSNTRINNKTIHIGMFHNEILAALAFDDYCIQNNLDRELNIL